MEVINRNFFSLLSCGAFGCDCKIEPMSQFKWQQTIATAYFLSVTPYLAKGIITHEEDRNMNLTEDMLELMRREADSANNRITMISMHVRDKYVMPRLANAMNNLKLKHIVYGEYHSIDTSVATLNMLEIIIKNINSMTGVGIDMYSLIQLGLFLRQQGQNVDFVKLETWLGRLGIKKMVNLIGNMLILFFGFDDDEIPFVHGKDSKAVILMNSFMDKVKDTVGAHPVENMTEMDNVPRLTVGRVFSGIRYFGYMPAETVCRTVSDFTKSLSEIEE